MNDVQSVQLEDVMPLRHSLLVCYGLASLRSTPTAHFNFPCKRWLLCNVRKRELYLVSFSMNLSEKCGIYDFCILEYKISVACSLVQRQTFYTPSCSVGGTALSFLFENAIKNFSVSYIFFVFDVIIGISKEQHSAKFH